MHTPLENQIGHKPRGVSFKKTIKKDFYTHEIKNLEVLYDHAYRLNKLFKIKDYLLHSPTLQGKIATLEKWRIVRNVCMIILIVGKFK
jgi:hypothetical protein